MLFLAPVFCSYLYKLIQRYDLENNYLYMILGCLVKP